VATAAEITNLLVGHAVPPDVVADLVDGLPGTFMLDVAAEVLAADLALCHPPLAPSEVRIQLRPAHDDHARRVTVVAHDRPGLLAATAGALAERGLSVVSAGAATWEHRAMALQSVTVVDPERRSWAAADWDLAAEDIKAVTSGQRRPVVAFKPAGPAKVVTSPVLDGNALVTVEAPDRVGLFWAIASWFEAGGYNVLAARLSDDGHGRATDAFLVDRAPDVERLLARLTGGRTRRSLIARPGRDRPHAD
jgi:UTP:GlnB (protein PII) uridylyltransferase